MKRYFLLSLCLLSAVGGIRAETAAFYVNDGIIKCPPDIPPQIDAVNFVNNNWFEIAFTNFTVNSPLFYTANTVNFTNRGVMICNPGFELVNAPSFSGQKKLAGSILNTGTIDVGNQSNTVTLFIGGILAGQGVPKFLCSATNIINPGVISMGFEGLCRLEGETVNLSRGSLMMTNTGVNFINNFATLFANGIYVDGYWGLGSHVFSPQAQFENANPPQTAYHLVTNREYTVYQQRLASPTALAYLDDTTIASNRLVRAVFLNNTNLSFPANVYFPAFGDILVEWTAVTTNSLGIAETNYVNLFDFFEFYDPFLLWNGYAGAGFTRPTYMPSNYSFYRSTFSYGQFYGPAASPGGIPAGTFDGLSSTNRYTAYEARFLPTTLVLSDTASQDVTNLPGRINISASKSLDLNRARISSLNFLSLQSTNHFLGSARAQIASPYSDINLRNTNGSFAVSNLLTRSLPMPEGSIDLYSSCWTNIVGGVTNLYHVLYVDAKLAPETPPRVQTLVLRSTNTVTHDDSLFIHDAINITRDLLLDSRRITIATNAPDAPVANGSISLLSSTILWPNATPRLQFLTNNGTIQTYNAVFFGGSRSSPFYNSNYTEPYVSFVNRGIISDSGSLIWASHFENYGTLQSVMGDVQLQKCAGALLTNGAFLATNGLVAISAGGILVSNHTLVGGSGIYLNATNILSDGIPNLALLPLTNLTSTFITNGNSWRGGGGFYLGNRPTTGDLLGTTVYLRAPANVEVPIVWAGEDRGTDVNSPTRSGFLNNSAIGKLILDGEDADSTFTFRGASGPGVPNAIYVDCIELRNNTSTNFDTDGNCVGMQVAPNMKVYFSQALANGISIAGKLNGLNGGGFIWLSNYNYGYFSSTNVVYPDGSTNRLNTALVQSCDLDSNGNGIVNCKDPAPLILSSWTPTRSNVFTNLADIAPPVVEPPVTVAGGTVPVTPPPGGTTPTQVSGLPTLTLPPAAEFLASGTLSAGQGTYNGLFAEDGGVTVGSSGYVSLTVGASGAYSGKLILAGRTYSLSGKFSTAGVASSQVRRTGSTALIMELQMDLNGGDQIRGTISDAGRWAARLHADRLVFNRTKNSATSNKATLAYTLVMPPTSGGPSAYGYGTVKIDAAGTVTFSGTLADGSKVTQTTALAKEGYWPLYASLYAGKGVVVGWMQFTTSNESDVSGDLAWVKPAGVSSAYYAGGFTNTVEALGSTYFAPATGHRYLDMVSANLVFTTGGVSFTNSFSLDARNRVVRPSGSRLTLSLTSTTGLFQGTTLNPNTGKTFSFQGVLFERGSNGCGLFLGPTQAGAVYLNPVP